MREDGGEVRMNQTKSAQADKDGNSGFAKFEQGDGAENSGLRTFHVTWMVHRGCWAEETL
jgi:hypothetical protein